MAKTPLPTVVQTPSVAPKVRFTPVRSGRYLDLEIARDYEARGEQRTSRVRIPGPTVYSFLNELSQYVQGDWQRIWQDFVVERDSLARERDGGRGAPRGTHKHRTVEPKV